MSTKNQKPSYLLSVNDVLKTQQVSADSGLSQNEVLERQATYGLNSLSAKKGINPFTLFINQFKDVLVIILLISAVVSYAVSLIHTTESSQQIPKEIAYQIGTCTYDDGSTAQITLKECVEHTSGEAHVDGESESEGAQEALLIFAIVFAIAIIGFFNEYRAEKTVEALKRLVGQKAKVRRAGSVVEVEASELVPGDIVLLEEGVKVPADIRLLSVKNTYINEASLTGESVPVSKNTLALKAVKPLGDQKCMAFAGTYTTQGTAEGVVVATGQSTELGKIAELVNEVEEEQTPMQRKLDDLGKKLGVFIILICIGVFAIVFFFVETETQKTLLERSIFAFTAAVALAVAAIPEGLAFVVRISLALGARRMAGKKALVRRLSAVEALGSTDVICSDKTGTLTRGEMTVRELYVAGQQYGVTGRGYETTGDLKQGAKKVKANAAVEVLLRTGALCNNAHLKDAQVLGDPTEGALLVSADKFGINDEDIRRSWQRVDEVPFTSERKKMTVVCKNPNGGFEIASKGATEKILEMCTHYIGKNGKPAKLDQAAKDEIIAKNKALAGDALRVLAFAKGSSKSAPKGASIESGLTFVGLQAMMDPPRQEVVEVVHRVQTESGIRVVMITGDYIETAKAVANEIGLNEEAISGSDLDDMSQAQFEEMVETVSVYARVNPEHKIRIVQALKKHGHQVAMTGDGVNDAPAIKAADIGIAMGVTGTDASKEAADLILLDDQFLTIIGAIEEGRGIFDNVRKFVNFLISCNIAEVLAVTFGILFFNNLILTAAQLLFINIVTDGLPAVALGSDPAQKDTLRQKPQHYQQSILNKRTWVEILTFGSLMTIVLLLQYWYNINNAGLVAATSAAFTAMVVYELVRLIDIRTDYKIKWFSNPWLSVAMASSFALQFAVLYFTPMANYFSVGPLEVHDWLIMVAGSVVLLVAMKSLNPLFDRIGPESHMINS